MQWNRRLSARIAVPYQRINICISCSTKGGLCETLGHVVVIVAAQVIYTEIERLYACTAAAWGAGERLLHRQFFNYEVKRVCVFNKGLLIKEGVHSPADNRQVAL